ncbi:gamma-glutamyltransferase family protein [Gordonia alkanivorans]|uniref:Putative gamma-glutamyltranspeptidase n=1 Tax=Gordonia alkanivorans NBRC 16433 TaxID=1027371 RepID=F9VRY1_9ACTN|nr:gamma-glutamyltransferase [Gordonia alkanivorans]GAA11370.1 putative gamma-glutamyltranspeptidase [Gordonia alkanivorans NBRC 16433]
MTEASAAVTSDTTTGQTSAVAGAYAVSTPHAAASEAAVDVLAKGGNAVDAAVAAAAVCVVVQPFSSSLAGVGWATVHDAATGLTEVLECCGTVPLGLDPAALPVDDTGMCDVAELERTRRLLLAGLTPALAIGWAELVARKGTWPVDRVLTYAIELAAEGCTVSPLLGAMLSKFVDRLERWPSSRSVFFRDGKPLAAGDLLVQSDLADTLTRLSDNGPDEFRTGTTAEAVARFYTDNGGVVGADDLRGQCPQWHPALTTSYRGWEIHAAPGPLGDVSFASGLNVLEQWPPFRSPDDPEYVHVSVESAKLVARERARYIGDRTPPETVAWLLDESHTESLRSQISDRAKPIAADLSAGDTITLCVVDAAGNAVNLMQTVGGIFGTGAVVPGTGMLTNTSASFSYPRNCGFNDIRPGGKLEQNPCLPVVFDADGKVRLVVGSPGGKTRVETVRQMLVNVLDFGMTLDDAVNAPRFLRGSDGRSVLFEAATPPSDRLVAALRSRGHEVVMSDDTFGTGQAVEVDPVSGLRRGGADRRLESVALAGSVPDRDGDLLRSE